MKSSEIKIETDNLALLPISLDFAEDIFRVFTPEITTYMHPKAPDKIEDTIEFIEKSMEQLEKGTDLVIAVFKKENKEYIGNAGLHRINTKTPEFGIWIKKEAHGNGYGKEAIFALKKWADENLDYEYLLYPVDKDNHASKRIPEALGGKIFSEYEKQNMSGNILNIVEFRIYS